MIEVYKIYIKSNLTNILHKKNKKKTIAINERNPLLFSSALRNIAVNERNPLSFFKFFYEILFMF